jgi:exonuclease III
MATERIDIVGIQETIKQQFTDIELENLAPRRGFTWNWVAAKGHSGGGILLGVKEDGLQVEDWYEGEFYIATKIRNRIDNWRWNVVVLYGPADHSHSRRFLDEIGGNADLTISQRS